MLQAAWAQLLMWLTGQRDVAFGTAVSSRPADLAGAESMVGLLINTVPVEARITPATTVGSLLQELQGAYNDTLDHQHLALHEIHRATGHDQLFDTVFVYENYPIDTAALSGWATCRSPVSPIASTTITRFRCRRFQVINWAYASNLIPKPSWIRSESGDWSSGSGG